MEKSKQLRVLETKGRYKVVDGRLYSFFKGDWILRVPCITGGYRQHQLFNGHGWGKVIAYEHEIVWLFEHGVYDGVIDHINKDRSDNRIENLRVVTENKLFSPNTHHKPYWPVHSGQVFDVLDAYSCGLSKSASARKAKIERLVGLYHINKFLKTGSSSYLSDEVNMVLRERIGERHGFVFKTV